MFPSLASRQSATTIMNEAEKVVEQQTTDVIRF